MPLWPAVKLMDKVIGVDMHPVMVGPVPGPPIHPYFGPIYLWTDPAFPKANVFINSMPACVSGAMGYYAHVPQGAPLNPPNTPYWKRYVLNALMLGTLSLLTTLANAMIAGIAMALPAPQHPEVASFIKDVTGIDPNDSKKFWDNVSGSFTQLTQWQTWTKFIIPPLPYCGANGSAAIGSPSVTVNGGPLAFAAPLMGTSCSDIPVVPNALVLGVSNVMVGVSISAMIRAVAVASVKAAMEEGFKKGVTSAAKGAANKIKNRNKTNDGPDQAAGKTKC